MFVSLVANSWPTDRQNTTMPKGYPRILSALYCSILYSNKISLRNSNNNQLFISKIIIIIKYKALMLKVCLFLCRHSVWPDPKKKNKNIIIIKNTFLVLRRTTAYWCFPIAAAHRIFHPPIHSPSLIVIVIGVDGVKCINQNRIDGNSQQPAVQWANRAALY